MQRAFVGLVGLGPSPEAAAIGEFGIVKVDIIHNSNNYITLYTQKHVVL